MRERTGTSATVATAGAFVAGLPAKIPSPVRWALDLVTAAVGWILISLVTLLAVGGPGILLLFGLWAGAIAAYVRLRSGTPAWKARLASVAAVGPLVAIPLAMSNSTTSGSWAMGVCLVVATLDVALGALSVLAGRERNGAPAREERDGRRGR